MSQAVRKFLSNEEHASNVVIGGAVGAMVVSFIVAVVAILAMR